MFAFNKDKPHGDLRNSIMLEFAFCSLSVLRIISELFKHCKSQWIPNNPDDKKHLEFSLKIQIPGTYHRISKERAWEAEIKASIPDDSYHWGSLKTCIWILKTWGGLWNCDNRNCGHVTSNHGRHRPSGALLLPALWSPTSQRSLSKASCVRSSVSTVYQTGNFFPNSSTQGILFILCHLPSSAYLNQMPC